MKKKIFVISAIVILTVIIIIIIIGLGEKNKMDKFFSPITDKEGYISYKDSKNFLFEYSIRINSLPDEYYDQIVYQIVITNISPNDLNDFIPIIRFEDKMNKYLPSPFFYIEPISLYAQDDDINSKKHMISYERISLVRKISKLSNDDYKEFMNIYKNLYLEITWSNGKEKIFMNDPNPE